MILIDTPYEIYIMRRKQPEGLVRILKERKREQDIGSMMERVKMTQDAMERIQWEEKGCHQHHTKGGTGTLQNNTIVCRDDVHGEDEEPKFLRCPLSEVVDQIKLEEEEKKKRMEEKRMTARRNRLMKEEEEMRSGEVEAEEKRKQRQQYTVKSIDGLGEDAASRNTLMPSHTKTKSVYGAHSHWDDCISTCTGDDADDDKEEECRSTDEVTHPEQSSQSTLQCNYDRMILHAVDSVKKKHLNTQSHT